MEPDTLLSKSTIAVFSQGQCDHITNTRRHLTTEKQDSLKLTNYSYPQYLRRPQSNGLHHP